MTAPTRNVTAPWVGRSIRRLEDPALVMGHGRFTADLPAQYWVRFVRSAVPAGRIVTIGGPDDVPESCGIITAADLQGIKPIRPMLHKYDYVPIGQPVLADHVVRFVGEALAAVYAPGKDLAEDLADLVQTRIYESQQVTTAAEALATGAPLVHVEAAGNVIVNGRITTPDFAKVWKSADRIVGVSARSHRQNAMPMEARAGHAAYDISTGRVTLTCTTQMPHLTRTAIADILGIPESDLRVVAPDVGGGFGQKMSLAPEYVLLVWLARKLRGSVGWTEDRRENLMASFHARDQHIELQGAFDADGRLCALSGDVTANIGAYSCYPTTSGVEPLMAMTELPGPYDVRAYDCHARGVITNTCPMAPYRGVSRPSITFALELLMDKAARAIGIEPTELRRRNLITAFPYTSATGLTFDDGSYRETMEIAIAALDLAGFRVEQQEARAQGRYLGIGFATFSERTGYGSPAFASRGMAITPGWETVDITIDPSGFVEARIGASPHGQGLRTTLAQIIADQIGIDPGFIKVIHGDTDRAPYGWGTFASRSLVISGGASLIAAGKLRAKLLKMAGHLLEVTEDDITLDNGHARVVGTDRMIPIAEMARAAYHETYIFDGLIEPGLTERGSYDPPGTFSNACHAAIVEVDIHTGKTTVKRFVVAEDAGLIINPMIADGQVHGGVAQGIGNALLEEIIYDDTGNILTGTLADFLSPTCREIPAIELHHIETLTGMTLTKAKGLGEGGLIGAPAAVMCAVNDALTPFDVVIEEMPATPQRVRAALRTRLSQSRNPA